jgi:hypothetical protein
VSEDVTMLVTARAGLRAAAALRSAAAARVTPAARPTTRPRAAGGPLARALSATPGSKGDVVLLYR